MRKFLICFAMVLVLAIRSASASEIREIELSDGSIVSGEVLSLSKGIYTIKSDSLGTIKLDESKVRVIRPKASSRGTGAVQNNTGGEIKSLQGKMMSDQEIMGLVQSLQNDPEFKKIMEDPEIMKAVSEGDIAALTANPRFMKLLDNSTVRDIQKKVK
jgi:hypothetical protein